MVKIACMVIVGVLATSVCTCLNVPFSVTCEVYQPRLSSITFSNETRYTWDLTNLNTGDIEISVGDQIIDFATIENHLSCNGSVWLPSEVCDETTWDRPVCRAICRNINYTIDSRPAVVMLYLTPNGDLIRFGYLWNETVIVSGTIITKLDENVLRLLDSLHVKEVTAEGAS